MTGRIALPGIALIVALVAAHTAHADIGKGVRKKLAGKILLTEKPLPTGLPDNAESVKTYRGLALKTLKHSTIDGVPTWTFHYTAFLPRPPGTGALSFDFYNSRKEYVANKRFTGIDPKLTIVSGMMRISEDDNVNKGQSYVIKLTGKVRGKERTFASTAVKLE